MKKINLNTTLLIFALTYSPVLFAKNETHGPWFDNIIQCEMSIVGTGNNYQSLIKNCKAKSNHPEFVGHQLKRDNKARYHPPQGSWHYKINKKGDLEVRDDEGVVRVMSALLKSDSLKSKADSKSKDVFTGMSKKDTKAVLGKPLRITTERTNSGVTETWEYKRKYVFMRDGFVLMVADK